MLKQSEFFVDNYVSTIILQCKCGNRTILTLCATWSLASGKQTLLPLGFFMWYYHGDKNNPSPGWGGIRIMSQKLVFKSKSEMCYKCFKNWMEWKVFILNLTNLKSNKRIHSKK